MNIYYILYYTGNPSTISDVTVKQIDQASVFISWDTQGLSYINYTQTLTVQKWGSKYTNVIELNKCDSMYLYTLNGTDECEMYNFTLTIDAEHESCKDTETVSKIY